MCKFHIFGKVLFKKSFSYIFYGCILFNLKYFMAENKNKFEKDIRILYAVTGKIFNTINLNIALVYYHFYCICVFSIPEKLEPQNYIVAMIRLMREGLE